MTILSHHSSANYDTDALQERAARQRSKNQQTGQRMHKAATAAAHYSQRTRTYLRAMPARNLLHLAVVMLVVVAYVISQIPMVTTPFSPINSNSTNTSADFVVPLAPLTQDPVFTGEAPVPESAFAEIDALAVPQTLGSNRTVAAPVAATVTTEDANARSGPGTNYDQVGTLAAGASLQLLERAGDWYKAQQEDGTTIWVMADLLNADQTAVAALPTTTDIPAPPPPKVGTVIEANLNLRDGPTTDYIGMTRLAAGASLTLLARYDNWFQVQTSDGQVGWVSSEYLDIVPGVIDRVETVSSIPDPNPALVGLINTPNVNLRGGPGTGYDKVSSLGSGTQLDLMGRYEDWFKVQTSGGETGWVSRELINVNAFITRRVPLTNDIPALPSRPFAPQAPTLPQQQEAVQAATAPAPSAASGGAVAFAMQFVGSSYVWGGSSPAGFDCSGFTKYVYQQYGLSLPHSAEAQYSTRYGSVVSSMSELQPGDIVFFVNTYKQGISHVGIYVGNGNVVQAMSPGLGVGVASINEGYWLQRYYSAIRPAI